MPTPKESLGFQENFLGNGKLNIPLLPIIDQSKYDLAELIGQPGNFVLDYDNYSVIMDKSRKFPILSASNIDGNLFKTLERKGSFKKDRRIDKSSQWGSDLYSADKSDFDKGHMTKREDVQWGDESDSAKAAAISTFYYTNAVPQHHRLNRATWRSIEDYILKSETVKNSLKVVVFTGPVLHEKDPEFVTLVKNETIKLPVLFWKIVYYTSDDNKLFRTAFLVSQKELLERENIVKKVRVTRSSETGVDKQYFQKFKKAETYQVRVDLVEELTGLNFSDAGENFEESRPTKLILKNVNVRNSKTGEEEEKVIIKNLSL